MASLVLLLALSGCPSGPTPVPDDIPIPDDRVLVLDAEPACFAEVSEFGDVTIGGRNTDLILDHDYLGPRVRTWPFVGGTVLVANWPYWEVQGGAWSDGILYKVDCATATPYELVSLPDADFGSAALDAENVTLYFTGPSGVSALDLETLEVTEITQSPTFAPADCWTEQESRDVVAGLDGRELIIHRGAGCGYEGDWVARELRLDLDQLRPGELATPVPTYPVASVAVDAGGTLWLGNGMRCDEPGVHDPQSPGEVLRSNDGGDTWEAVHVGVDNTEEAMRGAVSQVLVDLERPGHVLVLSNICANGGATIGGSVSLTRDGGAHWERLSMPDGLGDPFDFGQGVVAVELVDGLLEHIRISAAEDYDGMDVSTWETHDAGATWAGSEAEVTVSPAEASLGDTVWRGVPAGLERISVGESTLVYPGDVLEIETQDR